MLTDLGYSVLVAKNPPEAMQLAELHTLTLALLITDVVMPGMNGRELSERLQTRCPDLKCWIKGPGSIKNTIPST
jgi:CheY-like chemotaxis protein